MEVAIGVAPITWMEYNNGKFECCRCIHTREVQEKKEAALKVARKRKKQHRRLAVT
jgi:hypothetical protein